MNYFVISDIHGHDDKLESLLKNWNPDNQQLILNGDYIDRGPKSLEVLQRVMKLKKEYGAVVNSGNHEDLFLSWFDDPENPDDYYFENIGLTTIVSFLQRYSISKPISLPYVLSSLHVRNFIQETYPDLITFIREMSLYHETEKYLFVHAGINPFLSNWKNSRDTDFLWIREAFIFNQNQSGKIVVFGHTNTCLLHEDRNNNGIWMDKWNSKIGIDGGAGSNRYLNGLVLDSSGDLSKMKTYQV